MVIQKNNLVKRLISSTIIIGLALYIILCAPLYVFIAAAEILVLICLYEFYAMVEKKGIVVNKKSGLIFGAILPLFFYHSGEPIVIGAAILTLFLVNFDEQKQSASLVRVAVTLLGMLYVAFFLSFLLKLRCLEYGRQWMCFLVGVTKLGDMGAYFVGSHYGSKKLLPHISPNKTVEGAIAGLCVSFMAAIVSTIFLPHVSMMHLAILGLCLGALAQLGDLAESLIKRDMGAKDSGAIPGLGGMMDVLDSIIFPAPFLFYYLTAILGMR